MLYINKNKDVFGAYFPLQNSWAPGLLKFPENFSNIFNEYAGFIEITLDENDQIINVTPNEELFNTWKENLSSAIQISTENEIDPIDQIRADIDYLALMTGVDL